MSIKIKFIIYMFLIFSGLSLANSVRADYYPESTVLSANILEGLTDVAQINSYIASATVPPNTTVSVQFSLNGIDFYNHNGIKGGWDALADGANSVELRALDFTTAAFYYKLKFTTSDPSVAGAVSDITIDYSDTHTIWAPPWGSGYYPEGTALSVNLLAGLTDVAQITTFKATAAIPASTTLSVQFSKDGTNWYDHTGAKGAYDTLSSGENSIELRALDWTTADFYYRARFTTSDSGTAAILSEAEVDYSDTYTPYNPWGSGYYFESVVISTDLLAGTDSRFNGSERFGYSVTSLPSGATVSVQFSQDNNNWYSSSGTIWGWDTLSSGPHLSDTTAINLNSLNWNGAESFYYKLKFTTNGINAPAVSDAGLLQKTTIVNSPDLPSESKVTINASQADKITSGLLGIWSFDGPDVNITTGVATDRSNHDNDGIITDATQAIGKNGQALDFNGTTGYVGCGNVGSGIKTIAFWIKADDITSRKIMNLDGTRQIEINSSSQILATGFPTATVYVDGVIGSVIDSDWHHITIVDATGVNTADVDFGRAGSEYFDGRLDEIRFYDRVFSESEVKDLYNLGHVKIVR